MEETKSSTEMVVKPKIRGFVCITAHPEGCAAHVAEQVSYVDAKPKFAGKLNVLVIGASTGYGLASRIALAFGGNANTLGIFWERGSENGRPASAGWYNSVAFEEAARAKGLYAQSINGDAFSNDLKDEAVRLIQANMGKVDMVVYSLASPRRTDPKTGVVYKSTLKTVGQPFHSKSLDTDRKLVNEVTIEPGTAEDIEATVKVMGGEDWELWMERLMAEGLLAEGAQSVAYSYIGPELTWPIYKEGTIGKAKEDLERASRAINEKLKTLGGRSFISVNKALVTQASSAIPIVPLYISLLYKVMKEKKLHEGCIEQMYRLFAEHLYSDNGPKVDAGGRIRVDDWEMIPEIQSAVFSLWPKITSENLMAESDFAGYQADFLRLFGFGLNGIDYEAPTNIEVNFSKENPCVQVNMQ